MILNHPKVQYWFKKVCFALLILIVFASCKTTVKPVNAENKYNTYANYSPKKKRALVKQLIETATEQLGTKYLPGGTTTKGFDCSGLIYTTFKKIEISLPRTTIEMAKIGTTIDLDEIKKGDLIFFKTNGKNVINHVGMVVEVLSDEIQFIHAATSKGVMISSTKESYYKNAYVQSNRIF